jgi:hypothetical protein
MQQNNTLIRLEIAVAACHMTANGRFDPIQGLRAACTKLDQQRLSPRFFRYLQRYDNPGNAGCLEPRDSAVRFRASADSPHKKETL